MKTGTSRAQICLSMSGSISLQLPPALAAADARQMNRGVLGESLFRNRFQSRFNRSVANRRYAADCANVVLTDHIRNRNIFRYGHKLHRSESKIVAVALRIPFSIGAFRGRRNLR